jgi:hypothetical protein
MKKGFLLQSRSSCSLGPFHDERNEEESDGWFETRKQNQCDPTLKTGINATDELHDKFEQVNHALENIYIGPCLPLKTSNEPINALGCYYSQYYHATHIKMSDNYFSWNDENPKSHLLRWTSIFICPIYGEIYITGKWPNNDPITTKFEIKPTTFHQTEHLGDILEVDDSATTTTANENPETFHIRWMKTKKAAEHGAAAWAYDCFQYRHSMAKATSNEPYSSKCKTLPQSKNNIIIPVTAYIGSEEPYLETLAIRTIPNFVPEMVQVQIRKRQIEITNDTLKYGNNNNSVMDTEEELAWYTPKK